jgi:hypothetical protein
MMMMMIMMMMTQNDNGGRWFLICQLASGLLIMFANILMTWGRKTTDAGFCLALSYSRQQNPASE